MPFRFRPLAINQQRVIREAANLHQLLLRHPSNLAASTRPPAKLDTFFQTFRTHALTRGCRQKGFRQHPHISRGSPPKQIRFKSNRAPQNGGRVPNSKSHLENQALRQAQAPAPSLSERLRKLSREYGWTALGVYLALSALDFPFCFLAVRMLGPDRIGRWEQNVIHAFWTAISMPFPGGEEQVRGIFRGAKETVKTQLDVSSQSKHNEQQAHQVGNVSGVGEHTAISEQETWSWGVDEAEAAHRDHACE